MKTRLAIAAVTAALCAVPLAAEPLKAPLIEPDDGNGAKFGTITIHVWPEVPDPAPATKRLRAARPVAHFLDGFSSTNALVRAYLAAPKDGWTEFQATAQSDGTIGDCHVDAGKRAPAYDPTVLCRGLEQAIRIVPALDAQGTRVSSPVRISISHGARRSEPGAPSPDLLNDRVYAVPPPAPKNLGAKITAASWPPSFHWLHAYSEEMFVRKPLSEHLSQPDAATAIVFGDPAGEWPGCHIVVSSGLASDDDAACKFVSETIRPSWPPSAPAANRHAALLVSSRGKPEAVAAGTMRLKRAAMHPYAAASFAAKVAAIVGPLPDDWQYRVAMLFEVDAHGRVSHCEILRTSGSDDRDIAACRLAVESALLSPQKDSFGRAVAGGRFVWDSDQEMVPAKR